MKRTPLKRISENKVNYKKLAKKSLKFPGYESSQDLKKDIQALLRQIVILRDGGCFLRHYENEINPQYRECGGFKNNGDLILQAEHLHTRGNANSFSDSRIVVCCCMRHHIYYKPQHPDEYYKFAKRFIGKDRTALLERIQQDRSPHKVDLKLEKLALQQELASLQSEQ